MAGILKDGPIRKALRGEGLRGGYRRQSEELSEAEMRSFVSDLKVAIAKEEDLIRTLESSSAKYKKHEWMSFVFERHLDDIKTHLMQLRYNVEDIEREEKT